VSVCVAVSVSVSVSVRVEVSSGAHTNDANENIFSVRCAELPRR
jgi:hypothetical protein